MQILSRCVLFVVRCLLSPVCFCGFVGLFGLIGVCRYLSVVVLCLLFVVCVMFLVVGCLCLLLLVSRWSLFDVRCSRCLLFVVCCCGLLLSAV